MNSSQRVFFVALCLLLGIGSGHVSSSPASLEQAIEYNMSLLTPKVEAYERVSGASYEKVSECRSLAKLAASGNSEAANRLVEYRVITAELAEDVVKRAHDAMVAVHSASSLGASDTLVRDASDGSLHAASHLAASGSTGAHAAAAQYSAASAVRSSASSHSAASAAGEAAAKSAAAAYESGVMDGASSAAAGAHALGAEAGHEMRARELSGRAERAEAHGDFEESRRLRAEALREKQEALRYATGEGERLARLAQEHAIKASEHAMRRHGALTEEMARIEDEKRQFHANEAEQLMREQRLRAELERRKEAEIRGELRMKGMVEEDNDRELRRRMLKGDHVSRIIEKEAMRRKMLDHELKRSRARSAARDIGRDWLLSTKRNRELEHERLRRSLGDGDQPFNPSKHSGRGPEIGPDGRTRLFDRRGTPVHRKSLSSFPSVAMRKHLFDSEGTPVDIHGRPVDISDGKPILFDSIGRAVDRLGRVADASGVLEPMYDNDVDDRHSDINRDRMIDEATGRPVLFDRGGKMLGTRITPNGHGQLVDGNGRLVPGSVSPGLRHSPTTTQRKRRHRQTEAEAERALAANAGAASKHRQAARYAEAAGDSDAARRQMLSAAHHEENAREAASEAGLEYLKTTQDGRHDVLRSDVTGKKVVFHNHAPGQRRRAGKSVFEGSALTPQQKEELKAAARSFLDSPERENEMRALQGQAEKERDMSGTEEEGPASDRLSKLQRKTEMAEKIVGDDFSEVPRFAKMFGIHVPAVRPGPGGISVLSSDREGEADAVASGRRNVPRPLSAEEQHMRIMAELFLAEDHTEEVRAAENDASAGVPGASARLALLRQKIEAARNILNYKFPTMLVFHDLFEVPGAPLESRRTMVSVAEVLTPGPGDPAVNSAVAEAARRQVEKQEQSIKAAEHEAAHAAEAYVAAHGGKVDGTVPFNPLKAEVPLIANAAYNQTLAEKTPEVGFDHAEKLARINGKVAAHYADSLADKLMQHPVTFAEAHEAAGKDAKKYLESILGGSEGSSSSSGSMSGSGSSSMSGSYTDLAGFKQMAQERKQREEAAQRAQKEAEKLQEMRHQAEVAAAAAGAGGIATNTIVSTPEAARIAEKHEKEEEKAALADYYTINMAAELGKEIASTEGEMSESARMAGAMAGKEMQQRLRLRRETQRDEAAKMLLAQNVDAHEAARMAQHLASHEPVLPPARKSAQSEAADIKVPRIVEVVSDTADRVDLEKAMVKLPFNVIPRARKASAASDKALKSLSELRKKVRNTFTEKKVESGLPVIATPKGFFNVPESAKELIVDKGKALFSESAYQSMKEKGNNVSGLEERFVAAGEEGPLGDGASYYEADVSGMSLELPTPLNPRGGRLMTSASESLDVSQASRLLVEKGHLNMEPLAEFSARLRPVVNSSSSFAAKAESIADAERVFAETARSNSSRVDVIRTANGDSVVSITPPYGHSKRMAMGEALEEYSVEAGAGGGARSGGSGGLGKPLDMAEIKSGVHMVTEFLQEAASDERKEAAGTKEEGSKNTIIHEEHRAVVDSWKKQAERGARAAGMSVAEFNKAIEKIPENVIEGAKDFYSMLAEDPDSAMQKMLDLIKAPFFLDFQARFPGADIKELLKSLSEALREVTMKPNLMFDQLVMKIPISAAVLTNDTQKGGKPGDAKGGQTKNGERGPNKRDPLSFARQNLRAIVASGPKQALTVNGPIPPVTMVHVQSCVPESVNGVIVKRCSNPSMPGQWFPVTTGRNRQMGLLLSGNRLQTIIRVPNIVRRP